MSASRLPKPPRRWAKKIVITFTSIMVMVLSVLALGVYFAPALALHWLENWYAEQGEGYQLQVRRWDFAPLALRLELTGVELTHPQHGDGQSALQRLSIRLDPWALSQHRIVVQRIDVVGLNLQLAVTEHGESAQLNVAGLNLPLASSEPPAEIAPAVASNATLPRAWVLELEQLNLTDAELGWQVQQASVSNQGRVRVQHLRLQDYSNTAAAQPRIDLSMQLQQLQLTPSELTLQRPLQLNARGQLSDLTTQPSWRGDFELNNLAFAYSGYGGLNLAVDKIQLVQGEFNAQQQQVGTLTVQELALTQEQQPLLLLGRYQVADLLLLQTPERLQLGLGAHQFADLDLTIRRNKAGQWLGLPASNPPAASVSAVTVTAPAETLHPLLIGLLGLAQTLHDDEHPTRVRLEDHSVSPNLRTQVEITTLNVGQASSVIEPTHINLEQPVPLQLEFKLGDFSTTQIEAQLALYKGKKIYPEGTLTLHTRKLDMVEFNGYLIQALGYQLERGSLDIDADVTIHQAQLSGQVTLLLRNSKFVPANEATIKKVSKQISMPVETALDLLRDQHGNIRLTVPLSGNLDDPEFGLNDITRQLTQKALKASAVFFLKQTLQPYGTMLSLASYAGDYLFAIRLDALRYEAQQAQLNADQQANLRKVAELMVAKRSIEVRACPFVSAAEAQTLGEKWPELARQRGVEIQQWFEQNFAAQASRITLCRPQLGNAAEVVLGVN